MATTKRVFTLRLEDEIFDKIGVLAASEHRSMTNYIEFVLMKHLEEVERLIIVNSLDNGENGHVAGKSIF